MIVAVVNTTLQDLETSLQNSNINYKLYRKNIKYKGHIIFPSVKSYIRYIKRNELKATPIIIDDISNTYELALYNKICYIDARIRPNGIVSFQKIDNEKLVAYLDSPLEEIQVEKYSSKLMMTVLKLVQEFPVVVQKPFLIAFSQGLKDKWKTFSFFVKENRLLTYDNKKYFLQIDKMLDKIFLQKSDEEDALDNIAYIRNCVSIYNDHILKNCLDNENNIKV